MVAWRNGCINVWVQGFSSAKNDAFLMPRNNFESIDIRLKMRHDISVYNGINLLEL